MIPPSSVILFVAVVITACNGANILAIFPTPSFSHQQPMLAVSRALAAKGHNLTVINTNPSKVPIKNHRDIDISFMYNKFEELQKIGFSLQGRVNNPFEHVHDIKLVVEFFGQETLGSPILQEFIREVNGTKFDLIIYEGLWYSSYLGFSDLVGNPPVVSMVSIHPFTFSNSIISNPETPSYIPSLFYPHSDHMSFSERMMNFLIYLYSQYIKLRYVDVINENHLRRYFVGAKHSAGELERNVSLMIVSADLATGYPRPSHPNTIYVGPLHIQKSQPLPQDIQKWMDESEEGVIYFSLGSNMKGTSVPVEKRAAFIRAFAQFPKFRVLWKWEADTQLPGQPDNVLVKKWLPQQPILAHPKIRLFISQVGLQSFQEATSFGVPVLGIPMFGDQDCNARKLVDSGAGRSIEFQDINYENIYENLKELLTKPSYKEKMMKLCDITNDKPMPALDTAIWWIEYVMRHNGATHLRPASKDLTWYQYHSLDIIAVIVSAIVSAIYITCFILKTVVSKLSKTKLKAH